MAPPMARYQHAAEFISMAYQEYRRRGANEGAIDNMQKRFCSPQPFL
jgi:hypothetical protein